MPHLKWTDTTALGGRFFRIQWTIVPHRWTFRSAVLSWAENYRERYFDALARADEVLYISCRYTPDCMMRRNRYLVDHADFLIAVYDGGERGGTACTVDYARNRGRGIVVIDPATSLAAPDLPRMTAKGGLSLDLRLLL